MVNCVKFFVFEIYLVYEWDKFLYWFKFYFIFYWFIYFYDYVVVKIVMNLFNYMFEVINWEKELMKVCIDFELVVVMVGNVKIMVVGFI